MKKFLTALVALAAVATPVAAEARHRDYGYRHKNNDDVGYFLGGLVVGAIVGSAAASSERQRRDGDYYEPRYRDYDYDNYRHRRSCFDEQVVEYRYGRRYVYYVYRCR